MILTEARDRFVPSETLELLAPLIQDITQAGGASALEAAVQAAIAALGFRYFVFASGVPREADAPFRPVIATLPPPVCQALWESAIYRSNHVLQHLRATGTGMTMDIAALPPGETAVRARQLLAPIGISGAAAVPVISATEHMSVFAAYQVGGAPSVASLEPLAMVGTALSIRMLTLYSAAPRSPLTETQREILRWAAAGKSAGDIATIVGLSRRGCEYHLGEIYRKLGVTSRSQAVAAFARGAA